MMAVAKGVFQAPRDAEQGCWGSIERSAAGHSPTCEGTPTLLREEGLALEADVLGRVSGNDRQTAAMPVLTTLRAM